MQKIWIGRTRDAAGKERKMRMNKKNHTAAAKRPLQKKKGRSVKNTARNDFRQNPFVNLKEDFRGSSCNEAQTKHSGKEDAKHMAELIRSILEAVFDGSGESGMSPMVGVIELTPEDRLSMEIRDLKDQTEKYHREIAGRKNGLADRIREQMDKEMVKPPCDGCGEEVFREMLMDLNCMSKMILEADHMMKMVSEEGVNPEDARCVTYLSVRDARDIMKKWDKYRRCEI